MGAIECIVLILQTPLQDVSPADDEATESTPTELKKTLEAVSYIGSVVSIFCLLLTIVTYLSAKWVDKNIMVQ